MAEELKPVAFNVDDAKCFRTIISPLDCAQFQRDIDTFVEWSYSWKLAFNFDKCSLCTVTKKRNPTIYDYKMNNKTIKRVLSQKDFDIVITSDANFKEHIYSQVSKANK